MNTEKKKRGRKKKSEIVESNINSTEIIDDKGSMPKKRGRKPKGGKIITSFENDEIKSNKEENIILHLKCFLSDIGDNQNKNDEKIPSTFDAFIPDNNYGSFENTNSNIISNNNILINKDSDDHLNELECKLVKENINTKISNLKINLSNNNISDKRSSCFWCSYAFHNPPIFIPIKEKNDGYEVYGCFCTPECGVAYLMNENIDSSIKFERYQLMNFIYGKCMDYKYNIKPAPNPYYLLDKYYGTLSIEEYRNRLRDDNFLIFVDKPLTHIFPEMFNDNNDYNNLKNINLLSKNNQFKIKKASSSKEQKSKSEIVAEKFGIKAN